MPRRNILRPEHHGPVDHLTVDHRDRTVTRGRDDLVSPGDVLRPGRKVVVRRAHLTRMDAQLGRESVGSQPIPMSCDIT
jgi:hypothetical protein